MADGDYFNNIAIATNNTDGFLARYSPSRAIISWEERQSWHKPAPRIVVALGPRSHPLVGLWENTFFSREIIYILDGRGVRFNILGLFGIGAVGSFDGPWSVRGAGPNVVTTILVVVEPGTVSPASAGDVVRTFFDILERHDFLSSVAIEIIEGTIGRHESAESNKAYIPGVSASFVNTYSSPTTGSSVGSTTSAHTATLGYVVRLTLRNTHEEKLLGLTVSHAIAPGIPGPVSIGKARALRVVIESPSPSDHATWIDFLQGERDAQVDEDAMDEDNVSNTPGDSIWIETAEEFPRTIGTLFTTSGPTSTFRVLDKEERYRMDYGVVDLGPDAGRNLTNSLSQSAVEYLTGWVGEGPDKASVFKTGRSTGTTVGTANAPKTICRLYSAHDPKDIQALHFAIISIPDDEQSDGFACAGDEGSMIWPLNGSSVPVGLVSCTLKATPGCNIDVSGICFYTPINAVATHLTNVLEAEYGKDNFELSWLD